ncbi:Na/Pi symporter [Corynebacterium uropygiale]|uniref:Na/Pi symporter n=1 Tax=Corynebacterium uropygiale TaxID=1775911 RepID=A0A9X1QR61_9CORY|nr:Na/Pi symporter [Corynebacterium uropygiale]MCF4007246.1 Na/Pi symporter [Corynebacterium uropygiale]
MSSPSPGTHQFINPRRIPEDRDAVVISGLGAALRIGGLILAILAVLLGLNLIVSGVEDLGTQHFASLLEKAHNPIVGLAVGILITAVVQSSSASTALTVTAVGAGVIPLPAAVPVIMGANIGTTFTASLVAFSYADDREQFRRAVHTAGMHMWFNLLLVAMLLPLELLAQPLQRLTRLIVDSDDLSDHTAHGLHLLDPVSSVILGALLILIAVRLISTLLRTLMATTTRTILRRHSRRQFSLSVLAGMLVTIAVQASTVTVCSLLPFTASRTMRQREALGVITGANVGTTLLALIIAIIAPSSLGGVAFQAALIHLAFNLVGAVLLLLIRPLRSVLLRLGTLNSHVADAGYVVSFIGLIAGYIILPAIIAVLA